MSLSASRLWSLLVLSSFIAACGGGGGSSPPPNVAPVAADDVASTAEDTAVAIPVLANDTDENGTDDIDRTSVVAGAVANGTVAVNGASGVITFTPAANFNGATSFTYTVKDKAGAVSNAATVSITVTPVNDAPTITTLPPQATANGTAVGPLSIVVNDVDNDPATLSLSGASDNPGLVPPANISFGGSGNNRTVTVRPVPGPAGNATITLTVSDGDKSSSSRFVLTVGANHPPVANNDSATTAEDTAVKVDVLANDSDSDGTLDASSVTVLSAGNGTTSVSGGSVVFTPVADFNGSGGFSYTVKDNAGAVSNAATVSVTVTPVNDPPVTRDASVDGIEDQVVTGTLSASDVDSPTLTFAVSGAPAHGAVTVNSNGAFSYTPTANFNGVDTFTFKASDGSADSNVATVTLNIAAVNDPPVVHDLSVTGDEDTTFAERQLTATDVDSDPSSIHFAAVSQPAHGALALGPDGKFTYKPFLNFAGTDSFTYKASDGSDDSAPATVTLHVTDLPEAVLSVSNATIVEDGGALKFTVTMSRAPDGPVTVGYVTTDGTAVAGKDYTAASGALNFAPGDTTLSQVISVPVIDDNFEENTESLNLNLSVTSGADSVAPGAPLVAVGTIIDNDNKGLLHVGAGKHSIQPSQAQIDGILEDRLGGQKHKQFFNLGGFGLNPLSDVPDDPATPIAAPCRAMAPAAMQPACGDYVQFANDSLTAHVTRRVFRNSKGVDENEMARAFVIEQKDGQRVVFVMFDAVGAGNIIEKNMTAAIVDGTKTCGDSGHDACFAAENVIIGMTHSHTASDLQGLWGGVPQAWINTVLYPGAVAAVRDALADVRPAHLRFAVGINNDYNSYRRPKIDPNADADGHVSLLAATSDEGEPIGSILQYAAHPTGIGSGNKPRTPHPDFVLGAMDWLEGHAGGGTSLYYNGPIADASGSGERPGCSAGADGSFGGVRCRGEGIADAALKFFAANSRELAPTLAAQHVEVTLPVTNPGFLAFGAAGSFNRYYDFAELPTESIPGIGPQKDNLPQLTPTAKTEVSRVTIGGAAQGLEIVTIPGEGTNTFGEYIRGLAKTDAMLLGLTHNSFGYIIPEDEFSYVDQEGDDGLVAPFTGYEENVSMGPLTAPILRSQGYNKLFAADATKEIPPTVAVCLNDSTSPSCVLQMVQNRISHLIDGLATCVQQGPTADGCPLHTTLGYLGQQIPGLGTLPVTVSGADTQLAPLVAKMEVQGCDILDPNYCLFPFPNDHFTVAAAQGSPQSIAHGGTGRRVNINPLATPHNTAGKPVDPTEWNRNDGFSPGALIATYAPGLSLEKTYGLPSSQIGIANIGLSQDDNSPVLVIDATPTLADGTPNPQYLKKQLVWSEKDANANLLTPLAVAEVGTVGPDQERPLKDGRSALLIRPAKNFAEGHRYIVALRNFKDTFGKRMYPSLGFQACRGDVPSALRGQSPMKERCDHINSLDATLASAVPGFKASDLYLAWDFTVASTNNQVGRLRHMRDDAFKTLSSNPTADDCTEYRVGAPCAAPAFTVDKAETLGDGTVRIQGEIAVPSYLAPADPAPLDSPAVAGALNQICDAMSADPSGSFKGGCDSLNNDGYGLLSGASAPNRLFYNPADGSPTADANNATDPLATRYGDGLPDRTGTMQTHYWCRIPPQASPQNPARPGVYGHGLLDRGVAVNYDGVPDLSNGFNFLFCAVDWYGFATGDIPNVASQLADVSNFPVVPDASQQGILNFMFLARLLRDPHGFASHPAFQDAATHLPRFNGSEVVYDGNSQGGIMGGALIAASKDLHRGALGSLGMNYSTLLTRSKDFDQFASVLYASYTDPLDRQLLFSMIQMLWDRSENDGYAAHLTDNSAFGGASKAVKLDPNFGDQQVTMWSADVMARTMGIPFDNQQTQRVEALGHVGSNGRRHPDLVPYLGLAALDYGNATQAAGGAEIVWDSDNHGFAAIPPITNTPNRAGQDPHDNSAKTSGGRCSKAHFFAEHRLIDVTAIEMHDDGAACPALVPAAPVTASTAGGGGGTDVPGSLSAAFNRFAAALGTVPGHLSGGDVKGALDAVLAGTQQLFADISSTVLVAAGQGAGLYQNTPVAQAADDPAPKPLLAGAAKGAIRVPVGTPLGGYLRPPVGGEYIGEDPVGELTDNIPNDGCDPANPPSCPPNVPLPDELRKIHSPYATASPPSRGYYDSLLAKAVAMYDGHDYVVLVKTDFIGMLDELVQDTKKEVKARTISAAHPQGIDLGNGLIMSATHTHDGPGAVANNSTRYFWAAMDVYQHDVYLRVVNDLATVVVASLKDLRPAKIGHTAGLDQLGMNHYRRGRFARYKDNDAPGCNWTQDECTARDGDDVNGVPTDANEMRRRIGLLKVEDAATGAPIALVVNFSAHGIAFDVENQYFSGDVLASLEREVEQTFVKPEGAGDDYRGPIAMLIQNTTGDVTPSADYSIRGIEQWGKKIAPEIRAIADRVDSFDDAPNLRTVSQRIILNRKTLGYKDDEYPYPFGAVQCGNDIGVPFVGGAIPKPIPSKPGDIPGYTGPTQYPYCVPATPPDSADLADNGVAENGAFVPGDTILYAVKIGNITLIANPGEPLTEYGVRMMEMAEGEGYKPLDTFIWGYTGDHVGYILPPEQDDWATFGGAESTTTFWGWKQGQRFIDVQKTLLDALRDGKPAPTDEFVPDYSKYRKIYDAKPHMVPTPSLLPGSIVAQPTDIKRFAKTSFVFEGGDPVVDSPEVQMLHADGTVVRRANGEPLTTLFEMHLKYRLVSGRHLWTVEFEAPRDWAAGSYRFEARGTANQGLDAPYSVSSKNFTVAPATSLTLSNVSCANGSCVADLKYTAAPLNYRIVDYRTPASQAAPVRGGTVSFTNGTETVTATTDDNGHATASLAGTVTATGRDAYGNTAPQITAAGPPPPDGDGDGVPDASDQCPTQAGPASNNGCPVQSGGGGFPVPVCAPGTVPGAGGKCLSDIPTAGPAAQGALDTVYNTATGGTPAAPANASCAQNRNLAGNRSYQVKIPSDSGETISFQVLEPTRFNCANRANGAHPLILQGHGFGGQRSTSGFTNFRNAGYTVISFDQRGHNDSSGTIRVLDPDVEGKDLVRMLDWAEANLDYLAYRDDAAPGKPYVARPANGASTAHANLLAGSIGGSYGGGYQTLLHEVDAKDRLDAMAPDITWHDLRWSLNPGDVLKTGWDLLLVAGGDTGSFTPGGVDAATHQDPSRFGGPRPQNGGLDPYVREVLARGAATGEFPREALEWFRYHSPSYWCGLNDEPTMDIGYDASAGIVDPNKMAGSLTNPAGTNKRKNQPPVNVLFSQGMRDTLFNFNDAWANYRCFKARAGGSADVRLITHESGHILNGFVNAPGPLGFQNTGGTSGNNCGGRSYNDMQFGWFEEKLRGAPEDPSLLGTQDSMCVSLTSNKSVDIPFDKILAPGSASTAYYASGALSAQNIPEGTLAQELHMSGQDQNAVMPILTVTDVNGLLVAGIAQADITVTSPQMANDAACAAARAPTLRSGCDSIVYLSLAKKGPADTSWTIIDDQALPVRGLGAHANISLIGVAERLGFDDQLGLMVRGYSPQYVISYSRDATLPVVNVSARLKLPLYAVDTNGNPRFDVAADGSVVLVPVQGGGGTPAGNGGLIGLLADFTAHLGDAITAAGNGDPASVQQAATGAAAGAADDAQHLGDNGTPGGVLGTDEEPADVIARARSANRDAEAVVITGSQIPDWSVPEARGTPNPAPSGVGGSGEAVTHALDGALGTKFYVRDAHNGTLIYPAPGAPVLAGVPVNQIAAYAFRYGAWIEIPVQVDERMPYFLANANSGFSFYSGTDQELTYVWDTESWGKTAGACSEQYDTSHAARKDQNQHDITGLAGPTQDPVPGLDNDDEIAFMFSDAGDMSSSTPADVPAGAKGEQVALADPLDPSKQRFVYLFLKPEGSSFRNNKSHYVHYQRDANADQWIDKTFFADNDPLKIGTSNTGYGPNLGGTICDDGVTPRAGYLSNDRFPRDGVTVSTDAYQWRASGRWMVREMHVAKPGQPGVYGPDLVDRWKGRAFQQSPDTNVSVVGFEDEQVNWEANSSVLGERAGPVRAIREIWGADSGTNVTKTETFYRDAVAYRYRVRVHPIPPDGLYTSWDYNRGAMLPTAAEKAAGVPGGRYFTILRPRGVPIDGVNDDIGSVDSTAPIPGVGPNGGPGCFSADGAKNGSPFVAPNGFGVCPVFFDAADPTFNLPLAFDNWEQVSGKGDLGSLVYTFENKGNTSYVNPLVVPYYRDDACLDDGTGDDPVQRPYPGETSDDSRVIAGYRAANGGKAYKDIPCSGKQGDYGAHGIHYFFTGDSDNAFSPVTSTEIDGQQWQFAVPTDKPKNIAEPYANTVRVPLQAVVTPVAPSGGSGNGSGGTPTERGLVQVVGDFIAGVQETLAHYLPNTEYLGYLIDGIPAVNNFIAGLVDLLVGNDHASVLAVANQVANSPQNAPTTVSSGVNTIVTGVTVQGNGLVRAGVGIADMTPDVGYCAGQYCDYASKTGNTLVNGLSNGDPSAIADVPAAAQADATGSQDPYLTAKTKGKSYGVQSRMTARAIVVEGANGKRIALLKTDNYLAQDNLLRRVGQLLDADGGSGISYAQILYGVTHDHSAAYSSTLAAGPMLFEDAYDARFFENQARRMAEAIELAAANLKPARMGATTIQHSIYKGNVVQMATADDGTPAGYPLEYNDHQLTVMRFDAADGSGPIATWINWGQHGEGNDGYDLHSADFVAALERFVERDTGAPMVYSQGDVGSSENSANHSQMIADDHSVCGHWYEGATAPSDDSCADGEGTVRDFNHHGYAANERNVRFLADDVKKAWDLIGVGDASVVVPFSTSFPVDYLNNWVPGPLSHPYPSVSNCRTETTAEGDPGSPVLGLPDCQRGGTGGDPTGTLQMVYATMKAEGIPVPDHYDAPGWEGVEENHRIKLQAFSLGDVLLASCACEAQDDLILNLKSRTDTVQHNIYDGFDWACLMPGYKDDAGPDGSWSAACERQAQYYDPAQPLRDRGGYVRGVPSSHVFSHGNSVDDALITHMRAQVHNNALHWDEDAVTANSEPPAQTKAPPEYRFQAIWGNFIKEEIQDLKRVDGSSVPGYKLPVGVGHAGDYNGYTVSYREYMNRDSYRKALTTYGPHTADYMVTRLVRMAAQLQGGPKIRPETHDVLAQADEVRQAATVTAHGEAVGHAYEVYNAALPPDASPAALKQPADIGLFNAATFTWAGGSTAVDNPVATVQICEGAADAGCTGGRWRDFAGGAGETQTRVTWPQGVAETAQAEAGQFQWKWTANFEAYESFPARLGATPAGAYRFVVTGCAKTGGVAAAATDLADRIHSILYGTRPIGACHAGSPYKLTSNAFTVAPNADVISKPQTETNGEVTFQVSLTSVPRSYVSVFPFVQDNGSTRVCDGCSFRPWAQSSAGVEAVSYVTDDGASGFAARAGSSARWAISGLAAGKSATVTVKYTDGRVGRPVTVTRDAAVTPPPPGGGLPLCAPDQVPGIGGGCISDVPGGDTVQGVVDTVYNTITGIAGGGSPGGVPTGAPTPASDPIDPASTGGKVYQIYLPSSTTGETIAFSVFEPAAFNAVTGNALVLQGHGYGLKRSHTPDGMAGQPGSPVPTSGAAFGFSGGLAGDMTQYVAANFWVISFDQRGFGESGGSVRVMDPDYDGKDLLQILDWAEAHLAHLMYRNGNLVLGATGGSYGGGYQLMLLAIDPKQRLDAIVPQITWNDLDYSLAPNGVTKSSYAVALAALGEASSHGRQDMFVRTELLAAGQNNRASPALSDFLRYHSFKYWCDGVSHGGNTDQGAGHPYRASHLPPRVDALFFQGMHDALFTYNEGVDNYECLKNLGGDVRLYTYQFGHAFPTGTGLVTSTPFAFCTSQASCMAEIGQYTGQGANSNSSLGCGPYASPTMELDWMKAKLQLDTAAMGRLSAAPDTCVTLGSTSDAVKFTGDPHDNGKPLTTVNFSAPIALNMVQAEPIPLKLLTVTTPSQVIAGIPRLVIDVERAAPVPSPGPLPVAGLEDDPILFVGLARSRFEYDANCAQYAGMDPSGTASKVFCGTVAMAEGASGSQAASPSQLELIDDQVIPVRGFGPHALMNMQGIGERLAKGEQLQLVIYGYHPLYSISGSRQPTALALTVTGHVELPLQGDLQALPLH